MIEELWRRLRGIDHWPETEAEVTGVSRFLARHNRKRAVVSLSYIDDAGTRHIGQLWVNDYSSIYNLSMGERISVRYNPARPNKCWCDESGLPIGVPLLLIWAVAAIALLSYFLVSARK